MNEEILKEAVIYGDYIGYHWRQYTLRQHVKRMRELCGACRHRPEVRLKKSQHNRFRKRSMVANTSSNSTETRRCDKPSK